MEQIILQEGQVSDLKLIRSILEGEKKRFELIMRRYNQRLFRVGMSILNDDMETEDAMQAAYINVYEHLDKFENRSSFGTWVTRIMLNECLARKKKRQRFTPGSDKQSETDINMTTPAYILVNKELSAVLQHAVAQLPEKYRLVFILREIEEMSIKETSEALNIEGTNVKVRLNRAKTMLRDSLNGYVKDHVYNFHLTRCDRIVSRVFDHLKIV